MTAKNNCNSCNNEPNYCQNAETVCGFNKLIMTGQGTVAYQPKNPKPFKIFLSPTPDYNHGQLILSVDKDSASIIYHQSELAEQVLCHKKGSNVGLDDDPEFISYWFSFDANTNKVYYGKGEHRQSTAILTFKLTGVQSWMKLIDYCCIAPTPCEDYIPVLFREPAIEVAPILIATDAPTLDNALKEIGIESENLQADSKRYYDNLLKSNFVLDTKDFPEFYEAVEESLLDHNGWCHKKLKDKLAIFKTTDPKKSYLRISLKLPEDKLKTPAVSYIIEIWPPGHYSPIHNHGNTNSVIRCLYGSVDVKIYGSLSIYHKDHDEVLVVNKGNVAWITPYHNQIHVLHNTSKKQSCMTLQCYLLYNNLKHDAFGFITKDDTIGKLTPKSDISFAELKQILKEEWKNKHRS